MLRSSLYCGYQLVTGLLPQVRGCAGLRLLGGHGGPLPQGHGPQGLGGHPGRVGHGQREGGGRARGDQAAQSLCPAPRVSGG